ncbi:MAG TPA: tRNA glutamyl-Q(34) synthetase GluQRS [Steroidobacteraceae bacterium]|nr:tRNA glutamyl-Q(34) synthetase GluQRS [Steroidobacteraceae bacterium]
MPSPHNSAVITRFAPSPTGLLHVGHAYAAWKAWDVAEPAGFIVRIEDLDGARCRGEFVQAIFEDLGWLGLVWREPVLYQSARTQAYREALARLAARGLIYPCFCTRATIASARAGEAGQIATGVEPDIALAGQAPHPSLSLTPVYPGTCRHLPESERQRRLERGDAHAWRLDVAQAAQQPEALNLHFIEAGDAVGAQPTHIKVQPQRLGDIVLARKDLPAAYHLAVVLDDAFQHITLVTRGEDLQPATHVQRLLQALLGLAVPRYAHHRLILDAQGRKFSKRDQSPTLRALRAEGATPAALRERLGLS